MLSESEADESSENMNMEEECLSSQSSCLRGNWEYISDESVVSPHSFGQFNLDIEKNCPLSDDNSISEFFHLFFTEEQISKIVNYTNLKASQYFELNPVKPNSHTRLWTPTNISEIKAFLGLWLHMGIIKAPSYKMYWTRDPKYRINGIADIISRDRYYQIKKFLTFQDPDAIIIEEDKLQKIRPLFDSVMEACSQYWTPNELLCIDESMVEFRGRHKGKVYMPSKPIKYGFKIYVLSDSKGYVLKSLPSFLFAKKNHNLVDIVSSLTRGYEELNFHLFMDRYKILKFLLFH